MKIGQWFLIVAIVSTLLIGCSTGGVQQPPIGTPKPQPSQTLPGKLPPDKLPSQEQPQEQPQEGAEKPSQGQQQQDQGQDQGKK